MSELLDYIPSRPKRCNNIKLKLKKELKAFWNVFLHTFSFYDEDVKKPKKELKELSFKENLAEEQVDQCRAIFENSLKRRDKLENKAEKLWGFLLIFIPIYSVLITYFLKNTRPNWFLKVTFGISFLSILIAFIAILRSRKISNIDEPFISAIVDFQNDTIYKYSTCREGLGYLYCAMNNQVRNDHIADFVRAAEYFVLISFILLIISTFIIICSNKPTDPYHIYEKRLKDIYLEIIKLNNSTKNANLQLQVLVSNFEKNRMLLNNNVKIFKNKFDTQSKLLRIILTLLENNNKLIKNQNILIKNLKNKLKTQQIPSPDRYSVGAP